MRVVDQAIHDRVAEGGIADAFVPVLDRYLTGQQRGPAARAILDHLQQIASFPVADRGEAPVIEDQEIGLAELRKHLAVRAIAARDRELREEPRQAQIPDEVAVATGTMSEGTG